VEKPTIGAYGQGFYFTNNKEFASNYARGNNAKILNWKSFAAMMLNGINRDMKMNIPYCDEINDLYKIYPQFDRLLHANKQ
jgi:hypothetical protein